MSTSTRSLSLTASFKRARVTVMDRAKTPVILLLLAVIYLLSGKLGLLMAIPPGVATPVWPPSGIALAAILLLGAHMWPGVWLGSFFLNLGVLASLETGGAWTSVLVAAGIASGSSLQPLLGAWILRSAIGRRDPLQRAGDALRFAAFAGALGCMISATVGVTSLWIGGITAGPEFVPNWVTWWLGDAAGVLIVTPLLLSWNQRVSTRHPHRWLELSLCFALALTAGTLLFSAPAASVLSGRPAAFLLIPFLLWAALRFGPQEALAVLLVITGVAVWGTAHHTGPFALENLQQSRLMLEAFLGVAALTTLYVGAAVTERRTAQAALRQVNVELENHVRERTAELLATNTSLTEEVAERKRAEDGLRSSNRMLEHLSRAQLLFIKDTDPGRVFGELLDSLLELSRSEYGFIGRILRTPEGIPYLKSDAISNIAWNEATRALFAERAPNLEFKNLETLFGAVITSGQPVISNDPATDPRRSGPPPGHPPLRAFLGLPIHHDDELLGMVGVANREGGYDPTVVEYLQPFLITCANIFESCRNDERVRQAEREKLDMQRQLQETQRLESLGVLAGGIAHDFNNILGGILGNACLAQMDLPAGSGPRSHLDIVIQSTQRAAELCRQMLAYSGRGRFVVRRLDLNVLVRETLSLLGASISKKAELSLELAQELPAVDADAAQMRQVLMNLVINASEALGDRAGRIRIRTGVERLDRARLQAIHPAGEAMEGDYIFLEVLDTGCGMSTQSVSRIFDPFFSTKFLGRGLGLSAVLGIVRGHRGALEVQSEEGRGSSFRMFLPQVEGKTEGIEPGMPELEDWHGQGTVLVVEDEPVLRAVTVRILEALGFEVIEACDGLDGVVRFRENADRLVAVLLDLTMPKLDGAEVLAQMRSAQPEIPVLLMSAFEERDAVQRFGDASPAGFLQKPFLPADLQRKLRSILR